MRIQVRLLPVVLAGLVPLLASAQHSPEVLPSGRACYRIYSAVRLVPEVDDYVGSEIVLWRCTVADVTAEWRLYEGGHEPERIQLEGTFAEGRLILRGRVPGGSPVEIRASFRGQTLTGTALIGEFSKVALKLPRVHLTWEERLRRR